MCEAARGVVDRYLELSKQKPTCLKQVTTPCMDDHQLAPEDFETRGDLSKSASKIVLKSPLPRKTGKIRSVVDCQLTGKRSHKMDKGMR